MTDFPHGRRPKRSDPRALARFLQELSWLLNSYADLDFRALENLAFAPPPVAAPTPRKRRSKSTPPRANVEALVGVLPGLFTDERIFPTNEDIAEFATTALDVKIPRWQKKSKFELIGHIVCNTKELKEEELASLVSALNIVSGEDSARAAVGEQRQNGLSWNEVIQKLVSNEND